MDVQVTGDGGLELTAGGRRVCFPAVCLRDNCPCTECADPVSGQRLIDITEIPADVTVAAAEAGTAEAGAGEPGAGAVTVTFAPIRHCSVFSRSWLAAHALDDASAAPAGGGGRDEDAKELWPAADGPAPETCWPAYVSQPGEKVRALTAVLRRGFVLLRGVPARPGQVLEVAASFGHVRETNYGRLFDVRVEPAPGNLAFTSRAIRPHTDNPYRDPVPTVQLLHCLRAAGDGGRTGLVDGFAAAAALRAADRESFETLASHPCTFRYRDARADLRASLPLIELSPDGRIRGVRLNHRSAQPLREPYQRVVAFYAAYRRWAALLAEPARQLNLRLKPGDCLASTLAVLRRATGTNEEEA